MNTITQEAEVLRLLFDHGLVTTADIIARADELIVSESELDDNLMELSTIAPDKTSWPYAKLMEMAQAADKPAALATALGRMYEPASRMAPEDLRKFTAGLGGIPAECGFDLPANLQFLKEPNNQSANILPSTSSN